MKRYEEKKFEERLEDKYGEGSLLGGILEKIRYIQTLNDKFIESRLEKIGRSSSSLGYLESQLDNVVKALKG